MNTLLITPQKKIPQWRDEVLRKLREGLDIFIVGDTETTGTKELGDSKNFGKKDRVLEIGFLFYIIENHVLKPLLDGDGEQIFFHEYINPFKEPKHVLERYNSIDYIPQEVIDFVHGIDEDFLEGKAGLVTNSGASRTDFVLPSPARTFAEIKPFLEQLMVLDKSMDNTVKGKLRFVAHNALFDVQFMNAEWKRAEMLEEKREYPSFFEGFIKTLDTMALFQRMYTRAELKDIAANRVFSKAAGYSLDFIQEFYEITHDRDMHGALLDSKILAKVYSAIINDEKYLRSPLVSRERFVAPKIERRERIVRPLSDWS